MKKTDSKAFFVRNASMLRTVLICIAAAAGGVCIIPYSGIMTALPVLPLCACAAALIPGNPLLKGACFAAFSGVFAAAYYQSNLETLLFAAGAAATVLIAEYAVRLIRRSFKRPGGKVLIIPAAAMLAVTVAIQIFLGGSLPQYIKANIAITDYVNNNYRTGSETAGAVRFDRTDRVFKSEIVSAPTALCRGTVSFRGGLIYDNYVNSVENALTETPRSNLLAVLREAFPTGNFTLTAVSIEGYPDGSVTYGDTTDYSSRVHYTICFNRQTDAAGFAADAVKYRKALEAAGAEYASVTFLGGGLGTVVFRELHSRLDLIGNETVGYCGPLFTALQRDLDMHFAGNILKYR
ncbi:MAG: hypothetical protein PUC63_04300 [Clostridiales bacterium]|nr:hypothetical protein [Clostridiales bacterium]